MRRKPLFFSTLFALTMGFFESAVVVYLRAIAYPNSFAFPLQPLSDQLATTELIREAVSMLMLLSVAWIISKRTTERLAWFLYNFAVWDIAYYLFLKLLIGWPESFLTWDILFLLPVAWTGPVIAPVMLSVLMIALALLILNYNNDRKKSKITKFPLSLLVTGSLIVILSFTYEYLVAFFKQTDGLRALFEMKSHQEVLERFIPKRFPWLIFLSGFTIIAAGIAAYYFQNNRIRWKKEKKLSQTMINWDNL